MKIFVVQARICWADGSEDWIIRGLFSTREIADKEKDRCLEVLGDDGEKLYERAFVESYCLDDAISGEHKWRWSITSKGQEGENK